MTRITHLHSCGFLLTNFISALKKIWLSFCKKTSKISANCHCEWIIWCLKKCHFFLFSMYEALCLWSVYQYKPFQITPFSQKSLLLLELDADEMKNCVASKYRRYWALSSSTRAVARIGKWWYLQKADIF